MPGVLGSFCGFSREVGKMALNIDLDGALMNFDAAQFDEMAESLLSMSPNGSGTFRFPETNSDSDVDILADEQSVDLLKIMDYQDSEVSPSLPKSMLLCEDDCSNCKKNGCSTKVSGNKDPFMGISLWNNSPDSGCSTSSLLNHMINPLDDVKPQIKTEVFSAWNHCSSADDYQGFTKSSFADPSCFKQEYLDEGHYHDSSSTCSDNGGTAGDDSDVDIETVTDTPRSLGSLYSGSSLDCSPLSTPSTSPTPMQSYNNSSLMTILSANAIKSRVFSQRSTSLIDGISNSASLAENLMVGRQYSIAGRKLDRLERKMQHKTTVHLAPQPQSNTQIIGSSNFVNFHDYAMSPTSEMGLAALETAKPTVASSRRIYRKRQFTAIDCGDKEKQHHHNQLERNRRQKLADLFTDLRDVIPKITTSNKASKVVILNEATDYIHELKDLQSAQEIQIARNLQKQFALEKQLRILQSQRLYP